jgi:hypothetical protein
MRRYQAVAAALLMTAAASTVHASYTYNITQSASQLNLTVSGTAFGGALNVTEQQASAVTRYNGTIEADFPSGPTVGGSIYFPGGSNATAVNPTGLFSIPLQYAPNVNGGSGTAAANYGVNLNAPVGITLPAIDIPNVGTINLGTLQSVNMAVAIRNLALDLESTAPLAILAGGTFDPTGVNLGISSGFADLNGALVFQQPDLISHLAAVVAMNALAVAVPDLGVTVSSNILARTVSLGLGTRFDLSGVAASLPNQATTNGSVSYVNPATLSTLIIPVNIDLPDLESLGIPASLLTLDLNLTGQLRATAFVPEASSVILATIGTLGIATLAYRRRKLQAAVR